MTRIVGLDVLVTYTRDHEKTTSGLMVLGACKEKPRDFTVDELSSIEMELVLLQSQPRLYIHAGSTNIPCLTKGVYYDLAGFLEIPAAALFSYQIEIIIVGGGVFP